MKSKLVQTVWLLFLIFFLYQIFKGIADHSLAGVFFSAAACLAVVGNIRNPGLLFKRAEALPEHVQRTFDRSSRYVFKSAVLFIVPGIAASFSNI